MYQVFEKLCAEKNITPYRVSQETGISTSTLSEWKSNKYQPKFDKLVILANYFGVPVEFFIKKGGE